MAAFRQTNAGGTNGSTVTVGSGGTTDGSIAYGSVATAAGGTNAFDNTHTLFGSGDLAVKIATAATSANTYDGFGANVTYTIQSIASCCYYLTANPPSAIRLMNLVGNGQISLGGAGVLQVFDSAGAGGGLSFTNTMPLNQWCKLELRIITNSATVGQLELRLFDNPFSDVPLESHSTAANLNTTTSAPTDLRCGIAASPAANVGPFWVTQMQYSTTAGVYTLPPRWNRAALPHPAQPLAAMGRAGLF